MPEVIDTNAIDYQLKRTYPKKKKKNERWLTSPTPYIKAIREFIVKQHKKKKKKTTIREAHDQMKPR